MGITDNSCKRFSAKISDNCKPILFTAIFGF